MIKLIPLILCIHAIIWRPYESIALELSRDAADLKKRMVYHPSLYRGCTAFSHTDVQKLIEDNVVLPAQSYNSTIV